jgi:hypothetical protein
MEKSKKETLSKESMFPLLLGTKPKVLQVLNPTPTAQHPAMQHLKLK